jgi:hypothetical protein
MWTPDPDRIITAEQKAAATLAATVGAFEGAIQAVVDAKPRERTFRDGVTLASYVASTNEAWAAQAQTFVAWRDQVWLYAYGELAKVTAGERTQPTIEEFLAELPALTWPE